ncbi:3-dehydrosphinganine reductase [Malassezia pachydermatis]
MGLAECLRSELLLYSIDVHIYFPATILTPGLEVENQTKPELTKQIEGTDEGQTPAQCAAHLLRGVERNEYSITDGLIGWLFRISSGGSAPGSNVWVDSLAMLPARWAAIGWRRFFADSAVLQHARKA